VNRKKKKKREGRKEGATLPVISDWEGKKKRGCTRETMKHSLPMASLEERKEK